jgi:hypothetical protein
LLEATFVKNQVFPLAERNCISYIYDSEPGGRTPKQETYYFDLYESITLPHRLAIWVKTGINRNKEVEGT